MITSFFKKNTSQACLKMPRFAVERVLSIALCFTMISSLAFGSDGQPVNFLEIHLKKISATKTAQTPLGNIIRYSFPEEKKGFPDLWSDNEIKAFQWQVQRFEVIQPFLSSKQKTSDAASPESVHQASLVLPPVLEKFFNPENGTFVGYRPMNLLESLRQILGETTSLPTDMNHGIYLPLTKDTSLKLGLITAKINNGGSLGDDEKKMVKEFYFEPIQAFEDLYQQAIAIMAAKQEQAESLVDGAQDDAKSIPSQNETMNEQHQSDAERLKSLRQKDRSASVLADIAKYRAQQESMKKQADLEGLAALPAGEQEDRAKVTGGVSDTTRKSRITGIEDAEKAGQNRQMRPKVLQEAQGFIDQLPLPQRNMWARLSDAQKEIAISENLLESKSLEAAMAAWAKENTPQAISADSSDVTMKTTTPAAPQWWQAPGAVQAVTDKLSGGKVKWSSADKIAFIQQYENADAAAAAWSSRKR